MSQLRGVIWTPSTIPLQKVSELFTDFYKGRPWDEYLICPACKPATDFGPDNAYGIESAPTHCPKCGTKLELFWSVGRVRHYLFERNTLGEVVLIDGEVAAWWMGRFTSSDTFYIDVISLLPQFRKSEFRKAIVDYFKQSILRYRDELGAHRFISRTHREALHVRMFFKVFGFTETKVSEEDPERSYWELIP